MAKIHSTAVVSPSAQLADDVEVGPFCVVGPEVTVGPGTRLLGHCNVQGPTTMGAGNVLHPFCSIGSDPEDHHYKGERTTLEIGDRNVFREGATVNRGTAKGGGVTRIGNDCLFLARTHVAHDCIVGNRVVIVVGAGLSGHVQVGDHALISGLSGVHQFCRVGRLAVLSGGSMISVDLPPFMIGEGRNGAVKSPNLVGLKRCGFSEERIRNIKDMFKIFFRGGLNVSNALAKIEAELPQTPEVREFVDFVRSSTRGVLHGRDVSRRL